MVNRLISADSHVRVELGAVRERVPASLRRAFDDAIAMQAASEKEAGAARRWTCPIGTWRRSAIRGIPTR